MSIPKTMRAAQLVAYKQPLEIREVPVPEPRGENVLVRIVGSGLCHSDLHLMGSTVVIIGTGGLGQFGVQYARLLLPAATTVVAVDVDSQKLEIARDLGADVVINSRNEDPVQRIKELTGVWLVAPMPLARDRKVVAHNNLYGDVRNMDATYTDQDIVVEGDLVTGRTGDHCGLFASSIIDVLAER
jgi:D-arabinose 1-dehydrogenase-like Zn-dependent alcohol dehydrogenase